MTGWRLGLQQTALSIGGESVLPYQKQSFLLLRYMKIVAILDNQQK